MLNSQIDPIKNLSILNNIKIDVNKEDNELY